MYYMGVHIPQVEREVLSFSFIGLNGVLSSFKTETYSTSVSKVDNISVRTIYR